VGDFIKDLNEVQQEAVKQTEGPGLIIAGAGSGKTRVLTYRIAWLLEQGIQASSILALTFTNKAAAEMKERIAGLVGNEAAKYLWMGTFHSVFARILRFEAQSTPYSSNFTIYDTSDSRNVVKSVIRELMLDEQVYKPNEIFGRISAAKNNLIGSAAYESKAAIMAEDSKNRKPRTADIFRIYQKRLLAADAMDFDDLLLNTNVLFRDHPGVLLKYQDKFRYILVDEYQDTNYAQYLIISRLAAKYKNISVVGDDAQSIYAFRGARIENILNFKKDYPGHRIFKLEQNYRSTQTIVNAANSLIACNKSQIPKKVWSAKDAGEKISVLECDTDYNEGTIIAGLLIDRKISSGCDFAKLAILYRTNAQSRIFEEALRRRDIPYKVYGSLSFYQRKEIKDLLAYFRLTVNQRDQEAMYRVINYPARGIGKTTIDRLSAYANDNGLHPWEVISQIVKYSPLIGINQGPAKKLAGFAELFRGFSEKAAGEDAWQMAVHIASNSGILKDLFDPRSPENIARYENIQELLNAVREFTIIQKEEGGEASIGNFLQNVSLLTDADTEKSGDYDKVSLMTIHSAKGLEFQHVFIAGLEEELFPNRFAAASQPELEEERRLLYVALTRAGLTATLSYARTRYRWGAPTMCRPSRFLSDIDPQYLEYTGERSQGEGEQQWANAGRKAPGQQFPERTGYGARGSFVPGRPAGASKQETPVKPFHSGRLVRMERTENKSETVSDDLTGLRAGMIVAHERFGKGEVVEIEGEPPNTKATVNFKVAGRKNLLLKFAKLRIIS
jgi:DNA helicase II / ATP-dependent DNA helicase PcrA